MYAKLISSRREELIQQFDCFYVGSIPFKGDCIGNGFAPKFGGLCIDGGIIPP